MLEQARSKTADIEWVEGDAQSIPFEDASFDVVSSCFGIIFAPDPEAVAREITRVSRQGGRLGLCNWRPHEGLHAIYAKYSPEDTPAPAEDWGRDEFIETMLEEAFELSIDEHVWHLEGESPEAVWEFMSNGAPPVRALIDSLEPDRREELRHDMLEYWEMFRTDGGVSEPRRYITVLGTRR